MDAQSLAAEVAPVLIWREGTGESAAQVQNSKSREASAEELRASVNHQQGEEESAMLSPVTPAEVQASVKGDPNRVIVDVDGNVATAPGLL